MVDAQAAARKAVEVAAREIQRLADKPALDGDFEAQDLARYAEICLRYDHHNLTWLSKLQPEKLSDELVGRVKKELAQEDGSREPRARRAAG